jgi:hypothetical protein
MILGPRSRQTFAGPPAKRLGATKPNADPSRDHTATFSQIMRTVTLGKYSSIARDYNQKVEVRHQPLLCVRVLLMINRF